LGNIWCRRSACPARLDTAEPLQFDHGHLTRNGSVAVARLVAAEGLLP